MGGIEEAAQAAKRTRVYLYGRIEVEFSPGAGDALEALQAARDVAEDVQAVLAAQVCSTPTCAARLVIDEVRFA